MGRGHIVTRLPAASSTLHAVWPRDKGWMCSVGEYKRVVLFQGMPAKWQISWDLCRGAVNEGLE
eukprot:1437926-Amphidinium_carterae.1